jgi:hypothetical protein
VEHLEAAGAEHRLLLAGCDHLLHPVQQRARVAELRLHVHRLVAVHRIHQRGQVELGEVGAREPAVAVGGPLHGGAHAVAVAQVDVVAHPDLVAVVHDGAAREAEQEAVEELGEAPVVLEEREQAARDADVALHARVLGVLRVHVVALLVGDHLEGQLVVVAQEDAPLGAVGDRRGLGHDLSDRARVLLAGGHEHARHQREVEAHVALVAVAEVVDDVGRPLVGLGEQHPAGELLVHHLAHAAQVLVGLGEVLAVGAIALEQVRHGVEPEAVEAQPQPVPHHVEHGVGHLGVVVVEVGLVVEEPVPVVLLASRVPGPVRGLGVDEDHPSLGPPVRIVVPDVPVGLRVRAVPPALLEPRVLVAGVVDHQVGDDPDAAPVSLVEQLGRVADGAVVGVDGEEVGDVVAAVAQGRLRRTGAARGSRRRATRGSRASR